MLRPFLPLIVFVAVVLLEIFGFAWVGDAVGALMTVALVVFTAALGLWVFRLQGWLTGSACSACCVRASFRRRSCWRAGC
jgi:UPF0716 family protein affecting phage T7 exclusion